MACYAFDWDDCIKNNSSDFLRLLSYLKGNNHSVVVFAMLYPSELRDLRYWRSQCQVICTERKSKKLVAMVFGIDVDYWIDDAKCFYEMFREARTALIIGPTKKRRRRKDLINEQFFL